MSIYPVNKIKLVRWKLAGKYLMTQEIDSKKENSKGRTYEVPYLNLRSYKTVTRTCYHISDY